MHLFHKKLSPYTIRQHTAALRFFYFKTLRRNFPAEYIPFPKYRKRLPTILSPEEVGRLIDSARNLFHRTLIMTLYSTAMRRAELCRLKVGDIDSQRMMIRIDQGKGGRDREVPLSPTLLKTLRVYWRWMKPKTYLFPGTVNGWRADVPISPNTVWLACHQAAQAAGITKRFSPHSLRHYSAYRTMPSDGGGTGRTKKCSAPSLTAVPPFWGDISTSVPVAAIVRSYSTPVAIGTAQSVR